MVASHLNPVLEKDGQRFTEYGKVKSEADMDVVSRVTQIDTIVSKYAA
jgi:hypothetical protein